MERRSFLKNTGLAGILAAGSAPAFAQAAPRSQMAPRVELSEEPRHDLRRRGDRSPSASRRRRTTSSRSRCSRAARSFPPFGVVDAVQNATVQCCHTAPYYFFGKDPTFAFGCAIPFGMNERQQNAWMYHGGGTQLYNDFLKDYNIVSFPAGNTGAQMGGWFRKEIKTVADLKGLKMRIGGTGRPAARRSSASCRSRSRAATSIRRSRRARSTRRNGWVRTTTRSSASTRSPSIYYYPGWWEGGPELDLFVNTKAWSELPKDYQSILTPRVTRRTSTWWRSTTR